MHHVEFDFAHQGIAKFASVLSCGFYTDEDFAGIESYDVCRTAVAEELQMQSRDTPIRNQPNRDGLQLPQFGLPACLQSQTTLHGIACEIFQLGYVDGDLSLNIANGNFLGGHSELFADL